MKNKLTFQQFASYIPFDLKIIWNDSGKIDNINIDEVGGYSSTGHPLIDLLWQIEDKNEMPLPFKLLLRPLSSMTDSEKREFHRDLSSTSTKNILPEIQAGPIINWHHSQRGIDVTLWLLSKKFDIFNLIPKGFAIDLTTLTLKS